MPAQPEFTVEYDASLLGGINTIIFNASVMQASGDGKTIEAVKRPIKAIPYFSWNNRGSAEMQVWLPTRVKGVKVNP